MDEVYDKAKLDLKDDLRLACIVARYEGIKSTSPKTVQRPTST